MRRTFRRHRSFEDGYWWAYKHPPQEASVARLEDLFPNGEPEPAPPAPVRPPTAPPVRGARPLAPSPSLQLLTIRRPAGTPPFPTQAEAFAHVQQHHPSNLETHFEKELERAVPEEPPPPAETTPTAVLTAPADSGPGVPVQTAPPPSVAVVSDGATVASVIAQLPFAYISGPAGTGKTWMAREILKAHPEAILTATTGIAAVNLGDACTINSLLQYFDTQSLMEAYAGGWLQTRLRQLRRSGARIIILDEVSMLDADQLTVLKSAIDEVNLHKQYDAELEQVEWKTDKDGEMQLLLVGDFAQLPPVEAHFAFESPAWETFAAHTIKLETIRRQGDARFVQALQAVRRGQPAAALPILEPRMVPTLDFDFKGTTIVAKNDEVDRINKMRHDKLPGPTFSWKTLRSGDQQKDWIRLIPEELQVKKGALCMILANRPYPRLDETEMTSFRYVNGDLCTVVDRDPNGIRVMLHRTFEEHVVVPVVSEWKIATGNKNPKWEIKGTVTRMPLRLAYATTVHKSQGLTLDEVQVSMASWMFGKPGMLYVALSRCRTLEGLRIVGNPKMFMGKCTTDPKIGAFL